MLKDEFCTREPLPCVILRGAGSGAAYDRCFVALHTKPWAKFADFRRAGRLFQFIFVSLQLKVGSINELAMDSRLSWRRCLFSIRKRSGLRDFSEKQKDTVREA